MIVFPVLNQLYCHHAVRATLWLNECRQLKHQSLIHGVLPFPSLESLLV